MAWWTLINANGDGFNDLWLIDLTTLRPAKVAVYSRAGRQVYSSSDYNNDWGGTYNGNHLPEVRIITWLKAEMVK